MAQDLDGGETQILAQSFEIICHIVAAHLCGVRWTSGESTSSSVDEDKTKTILQEFESSLQIVGADSPACRNEKQQRSFAGNSVVEI
jgi:hypothetical protein